MKLTLAIERHGDDVWLVGHDSPAAETSILLARFVNEQAARDYTAAATLAQKFAREVGRGGLA